MQRSRAWLRKDTQKLVYSPPYKDNSNHRKLKPQSTRLNESRASAKTGSDAVHLHLHNSYLNLSVDKHTSLNFQVEAVRKNTMKQKGSETTKEEGDSQNSRGTFGNNQQNLPKSVHQYLSKLKLAQEKYGI